ncbi:MAG: response regulator [Verrucomicrobiota bacterium]
MKSLLHILHLEDDPNDAALVLATLEDGGLLCEVTRVQDRGAFVAALEQGGIDLVLSDFTLPAFDGLAAAEMVRSGWPDLPVILVSGTLGEELAIDALKGGATDYVLKERLSRLVPAVRRAMQEVGARAECKQLEAQFIEAQKMEVIGQLAGGVAHDFNNILMTIMGYTDLLTMELAQDSPLLEYAGEIRHASERAAGLTRQLLVFSRKETVQPVVLDFNVVVQELDKMLRRLIGENIDMEMIPGARGGRVKADPGYLGQILMNLAVNARDAMPTGGKLTIETSNVTVAHGGVLNCQEILPGDYVMLRVSDTGTGMSEEVKSHLFEAFFTTKPKGKGTGLGLATCHAIVQLCRGNILVSSELGRGTTVEIYFPRVAGPLYPAGRAERSASLPRGTETILVVEDEPSVRLLTRGVLQTHGYEVLCASNGQEALQVVSEHKGPPIRLVFTDVIMPCMGGKMMAEWLRALHPDLKILFTSGYTDETIAEMGTDDATLTFLPKPYTPAGLAHRVREMLDS